MRKRKHRYYIILLLVLGISIGFAYLTSNLDIVGLGHLKKTVWKIYFDNVNILEGENLTSTPPTTSNHNATSVTYSVTMEKPGDIYKFNIDIVNNGTVDAMVSIIDENTILTSDQSKYASYSIKYLDGREIEEKNFLGKHSKETLQVIIKYNKNISVEDLIDTDQTLNFKLSLTYTQAKHADSRTGEPTIITDLSGNGNDGIMYGGRVNADGTVYLDGVDDFIDCGLANYDFGSDASMVIRLRITNNLQQSFMDNFENGGGIGFAIVNNRFVYTTYINGTRMRYSTDTQIVPNSWYTLVGTSDGYNNRFYINGEAVPLTKTTDTFTLTAEGNIKKSKVRMLIGANPSSSGQSDYSNITITDALVFDRTLTTEEIATDYSSTINPTNTSEMLLRYKFSSHDTIKDLSDNNNNGTIIKGSTINVDGTMTLDGVDEYVDCGLANYDFKNSITYVARIKYNTIKDIGHQDIIGNWEGGGSGLQLYNKKISFVIMTEGTNGIYKYHTINTSPEIQKWYTIVATYDGNKTLLYLNGKLMNLDEQPNQYQMNITGNIKKSAVSEAIGANINGGNSVIELSNITVSDILIFDRVVTKEEVENDYAKTISPSNRQDLLLYYHFG